MFNSNWYYSLTKPALAPPNWLFTPVWSVLYILLLVSLIIYISSKDKYGHIFNEGKRKGYIYFLIQLILNIIWSPVFFGLKNVGLALIVVILLDIFVYLTIKEFYKFSKLSAILLIPYLIWILFATYLNTGYLILN